MEEDKISVEQLKNELNRELYWYNFKSVLKRTTGILIVIIAAIALAAVLFFPVLKISGDAMYPALDDKDIAVGINTKKYHQGDIIMFYYRNDILVKRVIADAGSTVDMDEDGQVSVDGQMLDEPYVDIVTDGECNVEFPYQVPEGMVFVMGDNRETSIDSRNTAVGCVDKEAVIGKLLMKVWPVQEFKIF